MYKIKNLNSLDLNTNHDATFSNNEIERDSINFTDEIEEKFISIFGSKSFLILDDGILKTFNETEDKFENVHKSWVDGIHKDIMELRKNFDEIDKYQDKLLKEELNKYKVIKQLFLSICHATIDFTSNQIALFDSLDNDFYNLEDKIEYVDSIKQGIKTEDCINIIQNCRELEKLVFDLKSAILSHKYKNHKWGAIVAGILGICLGVAISIALPWTIPLEIALITGTGVLFLGFSIGAFGVYEYYSTKNTIKKFENIKNFVQLMEQQASIIHIKYDEIQQKYQVIINRSKDVCEKFVLDERKLDRFIKFIERDKLEIINKLKELNRYAHNFKNEI